MDSEVDPPRVRSAMKVCFLSASHPYDDTRILHKEAHALAEAGYAVTHLAPAQSRTEVPRPTFVVNGVTIKIYAHGGRLARMWRLMRLARRERAHCYHCNEVESWLVGLVLKLFAPQAKVVFDVHEHYPSRFAEPHIPRSLHRIGPVIMRAMLKTLPWLTDYVILAKRSVEADLPSRYRRRAFIFNYGVMRMQVREPEHISAAIRSCFNADVFTAVHVGGLSRARGWPQLLKALSMTRQPVRAICLGSVDEGADIFIAEARRLGVWDRIVLKERVPYDEMFDYLSLSDVGLMLYQPGILNHVYAFPMKLYDYMWAALPSIGPDFAVEAAPVIDEERCGLCIDTADAAALARALDWLADNPGEATQMGLRAREAVRRTYNWEEQARRLIRIYDSLLGSHRLHDTGDSPTSRAK